ncbi:MAG: hypothetical protein ILNGONEN_01999 [Syntrophorhabdaceae bacterium]|nr:hypothetical protein [Syntrophorhabdaceae bacterium]
MSLEDQRMLDNKCTSNKATQLTCIEGKTAALNFVEEESAVPADKIETQGRFREKGTEESQYVCIAKGSFDSNMVKLQIIDSFFNSSINVSNEPFDLDDNTFLEETEKGTRKLKLRWRAEWGYRPTDDFGDIVSFKKFLRCFKLTYDDYEGSEQIEGGFPLKEREYIVKAFKIPDIYSLFCYYKDLPRVLLCRLDQIPVSNAQGICSEKEPKIAIDSDAQKLKEDDYKMLILHELCHFIDFNTRDNVDFNNLSGFLQNQSKDLALPEKVAPFHLVIILVAPTTLGYHYTKIKFKPSVFGWYFLAPRSDKIGWENPMELCYVNMSASQRAAFDPRDMIPQQYKSSPVFQNLYTEEEYQLLKKWHQGHQFWEEPLPYGGGIPPKPTEELPNIFNHYFCSKETRKLLETKYPWRYKLMNWYFQQVSKISGVNDK